MSTETACLYLCADGPLRGERHDRGPQFVFDGRLIARGRGVYVLQGGEYRWREDQSSESAQGCDG